MLITWVSLSSTTAEPLTGQVIEWRMSTDKAMGGIVPKLDVGAVEIAGQWLNDVTSVSAGLFHSLALRSNGVVARWPDQSNPAVDLTAVVAVAISENGFQDANLALKENGTVVSWGKNNYQIDILSQLNNLVSVAAGWNHFLALKEDGEVVSVSAAIQPIIGLSNVVSIAAAPTVYGNDLALTSKGEVFEWRVRGNKQARVVAPIRDAIAIAAGANHGLALRRDGTVFGWGFNGSGGATGVETTQAPYTAKGLVMIGGEILSNAVSVAAGNEYSLALRADGTVVAWGRPHRSRLTGTWPVPDGLTNIVAIAAGNNFSLAITTNRAVAERFKH